MKVLIDHQNPFLLTHGGLQIQIEQTKAAIEKAGVEVEYLRWWDDTQHGDIIQFFGRPTVSYVNFAQGKNIKVVMLQLLTGLGSRASWKRQLEKIAINCVKKLSPNLVAAQFRWDALNLADGCIANTEMEKNLMVEMFGTAPEKIHVIPNGVEDVFFQSQKVERGPWLVCTATIARRKRVLELAEAAVEARTPLWVIGRAYSETDNYARRFIEFSRQHPKFIKYEGAISDRMKLANAYRTARGFVLLSTMETRSLSSEEAAACECPLLLTDLPWARDVFRDQAVYSPPEDSIGEIARTLRAFYDQAPSRPSPTKPKSWIEVGRQFCSVYEQLLKTPQSP